MSPLCPASQGRDKSQKKCPSSIYSWMWNSYISAGCIFQFNDLIKTEGSLRKLLSCMEPVGLCLNDNFFYKSDKDWFAFNLCMINKDQYCSLWIHQLCHRSLLWWGWMDLCYSITVQQYRWLEVTCSKQKLEIAKCYRNRCHSWTNIYQRCEWH